MELSSLRTVSSAKGVAFAAMSVLAVFVSGVARADSAEPLGRNYYVATPANGGSDDNDGSAGYPFATLEKAMSLAADNDTVNVGPGTYLLPKTTSRTVGTTSFAYGTPSYWLTNAVTVVGAEGPDVTIFDGEDANDRYAFCLDNAKAVLSGVTIRRVKTVIPYQWHESATIELKNGFVTNCVVRDCALYYVGGINLRKGAVCGCQVLNVSCSDGLSLGAGINLSDSSGTPGVTNCLVSGCSGRQAPALYANNKTAKVYGCVFRNNVANNNGRGGLPVVTISGGSLENCVITNNSVSAGSITGAGLRFKNTVVRNCLISDNRNLGTGSTGGVYMEGDSALLENCTVVGNSAKSETAHGLNQQAGTVRNSIIGFNGLTPGVFGQVGNHDKVKGSCTYTDTCPAMEGEGNVSEDPMFVSAAGDWHLSVNSDLFDKGQVQAWMASAADLDGKVRVSGTSVNLGCYEGETPTVRPFVVTATSDVLSGGRPLTVRFTASLKNTPDPEHVSYLWTFGDGTVSTESAPSHEYATCGKFAVSLVVTSGGKEVPCNLPSKITVGPPAVYVNTTGSGTWPYDTEETGTNDVNEAVASLYAPVGGVAKVHFGPGTFAVRSSIVVKNDPVELIGNGTTLQGNLRTGLIELRHERAVVSGLTLKGSVACSDSAYSAYGGAITMSAGLVTNCCFAAFYTSSYTCTAAYLGGGLMTDCVFDSCTNNDGGDGGGGRNCFILTGGRLVNTVCSNCSASCIGAGEIRGGVVSNLTVVGCSAKRVGVVRLGGLGSFQGSGTLTHSRVLRCSGGTYGTSASPVVSFASGTALCNTLIAGCRSDGGTTLSAEAGLTESCTVVSCTNGNASAQGIVAASGARVCNTIVWDCVWTNGVMRNVAGEGTFDHCLTDCDPRFRRPAKGDYRPLGSSPACNAGVLRDWMVGATDLQGNPRILNGAPDIGCYESPMLGLQLIVR